MGSDEELVCREPSLVGWCAGKRTLAVAFWSTLCTCHTLTERACEWKERNPTSPFRADLLTSSIIPTTAIQS